MTDWTPLVQKIVRVIDSVTTLKITTYVGQIGMTIASGAASVNANDANAKLIQTEINMVDGRVAYLIHPDLLGASYDQLRREHAERERQGAAIVSQNVQTLERLFGLTRLLEGGAPEPAK
jgi:hypothetical protein